MWHCLSSRLELKHRSFSCVRLKKGIKVLSIMCNFTLTTNLGWNFVGSNLVMGSMIVEVNDVCGTMVSNVGLNILLDRLTIIKTPVTFLTTHIGIDLEVQHTVIKNLCVNVNYWIDYYELILAN